MADRERPLAIRWWTRFNPPAMKHLIPFLLLVGCAGAAERPNIVFLLADDLGWTGLRCFGSDFYETPRLDRMAGEGVKFTQAYAACTVCSPTRASIMTGKYPARLRLTDFIAGQNRPFAKLRIPDWTKVLLPEHETLAEALKAGGYRTAHVGKWHLSGKGGLARTTGPTEQGFDLTHGKPPGTRGYLLKDGGYLTDHLTDRAVAFIDEAADEPFFLYFAYNTPHTPIQGRADLVERFRGKARAGATHTNPVYAAMVASLDQSVGRVLDKLEERGLTARTVVVFTSDNGGLTVRRGKHDGFTENLPLRRGKGSAYEGGVRVPTIVRWPGTAPAGAVCRTPVITMDWFPTLLEAAGLPHARPDQDGRSLVELIRRPDRGLARDLFWHHPHYHAGGDGPYSAVRSGNWRLIEFHEDGRLELYNLGEDLGERNNLASVEAERAKALHAKLVAWREAVDAQMPTPNPAHDPARERTEGKARRK